MKRSRKVVRRGLLCVCTAAVMASAAHGQTKRALLIGINDYAPPAGMAVPVEAAGHAPDSRFAAGDTWVSLHGPAVDVDQMQVLLSQHYGFSEVTVLKEQDATRAGILAAINKLVAETKPGDFDVFYYSGHGSRRLDTLSPKDHFDETIVPIDAWKGAEDIRDQEMALLFDKIVFDKRAHLTAIYDSCNSGTMARGVSDVVTRALPYDDRDVAQEKKSNPSTVTQADIDRRPAGKRIPQDGDAVIVAAAASTQEAAEARFPENGGYVYHGVFTRALVNVLSSSTQTLSASDVVAEVSDVLHADPGLYQQPSVEGRTDESLFGAPVASHTLHVRVTAVSGSTVTLDLGSAAGFDVGTQFTQIETPAGQAKTVIQVDKVDGPLSATAHVVVDPDPSIPKPAPVTIGEPFELSQMVYPVLARLTVFASASESSPADAAAQAKAAFPGLKWVDDPAAAKIDYLVAKGSQGWVAYNHDWQPTAPGSTAQGAAYLLLGPPPSLRSGIEETVPFKRNAFVFTDNIGEAQYLLAARQRADGTMEYALFDPVVLTKPQQADWVTSAETDPDDATLNGGTDPNVVCRHDVSLPVRTGWLPDRMAGDQTIVLALNRRIVRLGKLRTWEQSPALASGVGGWSYHLSVTQAGADKPVSGLMQPNEEYDIGLLTTASQRASAMVAPMYVYLFGFDCAANPFLLYPSRNLNGGGTLPQPGTDGVYPLAVKLMTEQVGTPLGADTLFLMATPDKISDPGILTFDGVLGTRGVSNPFENLFTDMNDAGVRGPRNVPTNWSVQQLVLPSKPN